MMCESRKVFLEGLKGSNIIQGVSLNSAESCGLQYSTETCCWLENPPWNYTRAAYDFLPPC